MKIILKAVIASTLVLATAPVSASTLVLFDFNAAEGDRVTSSPYVDQELQRMARQGLIRPVGVPINDMGARQTTSVDVVSPVSMPPLGVGVRVLTGRVTWQITTQRNGDQLSYEAIIRTTQGFDNGIGAPTQTTSGETSLVGVANMSNEGRPAFARRYATPGGSRMLVGIIQP